MQINRDKGNQWKDEALESSQKGHGTYGFIQYVGVDKEDPELKYSRPSIFILGEHA